MWRHDLLDPQKLERLIMRQPHQFKLWKVVIYQNVSSLDSQNLTKDVVCMMWQLMQLKQLYGSFS